MALVWTRFVRNADSPYPEDRQTYYTCRLHGLQIDKEGDGNWWLRQHGKPVGFGPRLRDAKARAEQLMAEQTEG